MKLVGLSGYAQVGKDTVALLLADHGFERRAFADKIRAALYTLNPLVGACDCGLCCPAVKDYAELVDEHGYEGARITEYADEVRRLMQRLGYDVGRNLLGEDVWVNLAFEALVDDPKCLNSIEGVADAPGACVFTDVRFPNEAKAIKYAGGEMWRVERPGYGPVNDHPSETALDDWPFDVRICNDADLDTLARRVARAVTS